MFVDFSLESEHDVSNSCSPGGCSLEKLQIPGSKTSTVILGGPFRC